MERLVLLEERVRRLEAKVAKLAGEEEECDIYLVLAHDNRHLGELFVSGCDYEGKYHTLEYLVDEFLAYEDAFEIPLQLPATIAAFERCLAKLKAAVKEAGE